MRGGGAEGINSLTSAPPRPPRSLSSPQLRHTAAGFPAAATLVGGVRRCGKVAGITVPFFAAASKYQQTANSSRSR